MNFQPKTQPYCVSIKNASDSVQDISLFNRAHHQLLSLEGDYRDGNDIIIKSGIPNVSYRDILYEMLCNPVTIRMAYVAAISGDIKKIFKYASILIIKSEDASGNIAITPREFRIDPMQFQSGIWVKIGEPDLFRIDGLTSINFRLPGESEISLRLYPSEKPMAPIQEPAQLKIDKRKLRRQK